MRTDIIQVDNQGNGFAEIMVIPRSGPALSSS